MQFSTVVPLLDGLSKIHHSSRIFSIGSCFATHLAQKLDYHGFYSIQNPWGILFHPLALENFISRAVEGKPVEQSELFFYNEKWSHYQAHSQCSRREKSEVLELLNSNLEQSNHFLKSASHIVVTLGTAWVYRIADSDEVVANCHKVPNSHFVKELLSIDSITHSLERMVNRLQEVNPDAQIIFTISPVRHLKDTLIGNQRSKAHLIAALHSFLEHSNFNCAYFPSYEILMDELRDYRFYADDLIHPSAMAVDYIWEKFCRATMNDETLQTVKEVAQIRLDLNHRSFDPHSEASKKHKEKTQQKIERLRERVPHLNL